MIGKTLQNGKYEIKRVLGQGGFGITYEGVQTGLGRKVAIKEFFMKDFCERETGTSQVTIVGTEGNRSLVERFKEKFIKEAQMIAGLEDVPHIIRIYDIFQENGTAYYVMQFIEGGSLDSKIKKEGAVNESVAIGYITQMADALRQLHEQKIMHLDIKPANVLLRGNDLSLIDFGVSKHYDAEGDATTTTPVGRSKGYAPIEQYRQGGVQSFSPETDIYSLGATAYFLVTGKTPPEATELIIDPIQRPAGISDSLWNVISICMNPNKNNRPHSIVEFKRLLVIKAKDVVEKDYKKEGNDEVTIYDVIEQKEKKIKIIGVGGGACNAVNAIYRKGHKKNISFMAIDMDIFALEESPIDDKIHIDGSRVNINFGLPKIKAATKNTSTQIKAALNDGTNVVIIVACMGASVGTAATPIIASISKDIGITTYIVVTTPFRFEGFRKIELAQLGIKELSNFSNLHVVDNEKLRDKYPSLSVVDAFSKSNQAIYEAVSSIIKSENI